MRKLEIQFSAHHASCVFPDSLEQLPQALGDLGLVDSYPVIVLIGGFIQEAHVEATQRAIETIAAFAEENGVLVICGGSDLGVMASIGRTRAACRDNFPLLGVNLEELVTWPGSPRGHRFLWWGEKRVSLAPGYSHFLLVPGTHYGEDSPWIAEAAGCLSQGNQSVTILANGGSVSRKDIALSLEQGRQVIVLAGTGRLADQLAGDPDRSAMVASVDAQDEQSLRQILQMAISTRRISNDRRDES